MHQFREALDKQGPALAAAAVRSLAKPKSPSTAAQRTEVVSVRTSPRQFDAWLRSINSCASIGDAKRLRSDVTAQIRKAKLATGALPFRPCKVDSVLTIALQTAKSWTPLSTEFRSPNGSTTLSGCMAQRDVSIAALPSSVGLAYLA